MVMTLPRSKTPYETVMEGDWVQPIKRGYRMACCDCGLVHTLNFRIKGGRAQFQAFRNERSTGAVRRRKHKFVRRKS